MIQSQAITGDATNLYFVKSNSVDLAIAAPPFINRDPEYYGGDPKKQINYNSKNMLKLLLKSTKEMQRVIKPKGSIWIEVSPEDGLMYKYVSEILNKTNLIHADTIIHKIANIEGKSRSDEFIYQDWLMWFHFVKQEDFYFNPFKVKKFKDPIWELDLTNEKDIIDRALQVENPNVFQYTVVKDIPERFIEMYTKPGSMVLDLFGGSGTVSGVAHKLGRNSISVDISPEQTSLAKKRLDLIKSMSPDV